MPTGLFSHKRAETVMEQEERAKAHFCQGMSDEDTPHERKSARFSDRAPPALCEWCDELPAGAVAATTARAPTGASTHLGVAIAAIDWLVATRLEGHARLAAAI